MHIEHLFVDEGYRRNGVARQLYDAIALSEGVRLLTATVQRSDDSVAFHDAYRRRIDPHAPRFTGGRWECPAHNAFKATRAPLLW